MKKITEMYELQDPWGCGFLSEAFRGWISQQWEDLQDSLKSKPILDVGGGEAQYYTSLKPIIREYHLLDISPIAVERAKEVLKGVPHKTFCQSLDSFKPGHHQYGMIWLFSILTFVGAVQHPKVIHKILKRLSEGVPSGGLILLIHPFYSDLEKQALLEHGKLLQSFGFRENASEDRVVGKQIFLMQSFKKA